MTTLQQDAPSPVLSSVNSDYVATMPSTMEEDDVPLLTSEVEERCETSSGGLVNTTLGEDDVPPIYIENTSKQSISLPCAEDIIPKPENQEEVTRFRVTIEPVICCVMLGLGFQSVTNYTLLLFMVCHVAYNHSETECRNYSSPIVTASEVQSMAADITLYRSLLETIPCLILSFFVGPWSDKHGRKLPMIVPIIGFTLSAMANLVAAVCTQLSPFFLLLPSSLLGITGGLACFLMGIFSYVSDVSNSRTRTMRIAFVDLSMVIGLGVGVAVSGAVYRKWGYIPSYGVSVFLYVFAFVYLVMFVSESLTQTDTDKKSSWKTILHLHNLLETFNVCFMQREGNQRGYILGLIASLCVMLLPFVGESAVNALYFSKKFSWDQTDQSYYSAFTMAVSITGVAILFRFVIKKLKIPDLILGLIALIGYEIKSLFTAFSQEGWQLYVGASLAFFQPLALPVVRSVLTKLVTSSEQGKIFAFMTSCETSVPLFANVIYTQVYKVTEGVFPGTVYLFTASAMIVPTVAFSWIYLDMKKRKFQYHGSIVDNQETANDTRPNLEPVNV